jgi:hypothetical protein
VRTPTGMPVQRSRAQRRAWQISVCGSGPNQGQARRGLRTRRSLTDLCRRCFPGSAQLLAGTRQGRTSHDRSEIGATVAPSAILTPTHIEPVRPKAGTARDFGPRCSAAKRFGHQENIPA